MRFDLTDLRLFLTVAEQGSLTRGARTMNLALASASARVSRMEAAFGAPLLERTRRGVRTTAAGEALILHARLILGQVEQMRGDLRQFATGLKGRIRLLSNTAALASVLPQQLCRFLSAYPDLSVDLHERPSAEIALALAEGRADLGIVADITDLAALQTHLLAEDQLVVLACATHPIAGREAVAFMDVVDEPFVGFSDTALEIHLAERAARLGRRLHYRVQLRTIEQVGAMVEAGVGIAIVSQIAAAKVRSLGPAAVPLNEPWASRRLHLCASDFASLTPHARLLAAQLMEATWQ